jgi:hypothetical protein
MDFHEKSGFSRKIRNFAKIQKKQQVFIFCGKVGRAQENINLELPFLLRNDAPL